MQPRRNHPALVLGLLAVLAVPPAYADAKGTLAPGGGSSTRRSTSVADRDLRDREACLKAIERRAAEGTGTSEPVVDKKRSEIEDCEPPKQPIPTAITPKLFTAVRTAPFTGPGPTRQKGGSFRLTCPATHILADDPIVWPGKPGASHTHVFFGNASTNAATTDASLATAASSCAGGTANRSSYWMPVLFDPVDMQAMIPKDGLWYYKHGTSRNLPAELKAPPNGLKMIAGNSPTNEKRITGSRLVRYSCGNRFATAVEFPDCPGPNELKIELWFPQCWDGVNLDSPDHRSHMKYWWQFPDRKCQGSHPVALPEITLNVTYAIPAGKNARNLRLASDTYPLADAAGERIPGGYSMHGDVWIKWDEEIKAAWMANCINAAMDCHAFLLGDGRRLY